MLPDEIAHQRTALGENLIDVPIGPFHRIEYLPDVLVGYLLMKQIAHRVHEDELRTPPMQRLLYTLRPQGQVETGFERMALDPAKTLGKPFGVAMIASGADLRAARNRVPGAVRPLDGAFQRHKVLFRISREVSDCVRFRWTQ